MHRAPSAVSLLCAACTRLVTPCLVCGHLIPCCFCRGNFSRLECGKCSALNPLEDEERKILGFPPALALPPSMVRRVLIAHIGRPLSTLAIRLHHQHSQQALLSKQLQDASEDQGGRDSCAFEELALSRFSHLPFLQSDGIVTSFVQKQIVDKNDDKHLEADQDSGVSCANCNRSCNCLTKFGDDFTTDEALRHSQEQLVALHCTVALSTDLNGSGYPLCNTLMKSSLSIQETKTCNLRVSRDCSLGMGKGLSIDMLRVVSSVFVKNYEIWLAAKEVTLLESCKLDDLLKCMEDFGGKQGHLIDLQKSMLRAVAARKQLSTDDKVNPSLVSTVSVLEQLFSDRSNERTEKFSRAAEPYQDLTKQINLFLEFLYARSHAAASQMHSFPLCTKTNSVFECNDAFLEKRQLQTAVSYWLLMYHDVAHAVHINLN